MAEGSILRKSEINPKLFRDYVILSENGETYIKLPDGYFALFRTEKDVWYASLLQRVDAGENPSYMVVKDYQSNYSNVQILEDARKYANSNSALKLSEVPDCIPPFADMFGPSVVRMFHVGTDGNKTCIRMPKGYCLLARGNGNGTDEVSLAQEIEIQIMQDGKQGTITEYAILHDLSGLTNSQMAEFLHKTYQFDL